MSDEQKDWRTKEIDKLGGLENYHKKYGNSKTGKLVKEEIKAVEETPATKGGETGKVVATTAVDKDQLDINEQRTENRESRLNTRQLKQTQIKKARNNYDPKIHGDNKRAYMKSVKQQAKNTMKKTFKKLLATTMKAKALEMEVHIKQKKTKMLKTFLKGNTMQRN